MAATAAVASAWPAATNGHSDVTSVAGPATGPLSVAEAVKEVQRDISTHFRLFRIQPAAPMPPDVALAIASPSRFGRNAELARGVATPNGPGWVIPGDGYICIAVPDPVDGYAESCTATEVAVKQGLWVALEGEGTDAEAIDTILVPDGARAFQHAPSGPQRLEDTPTGVLRVVRSAEQQRPYVSLGSS